MPEGGGLSAIGLDWKLFLSQVINFLILVLILVKFLYRPIIKVLDERAARVKESEEQAEKIKIAQEELNQKQQKILAEAQSEALKMLEDAKKEAAEIIKESQAKAARQFEDAILKTKSQIAQEREKMWRQLKGELVYLVIKTSEKLISEKVDPQIAKKLSQQSVSEIKEVL